MSNPPLNRFVSTLAGAFRSFYIYNQDNKAFDEIMQNLVKRFQDVSAKPEPINLVITNRSLLHEGEPVGFQEIVVPLANTLRTLGYKAIRFQAPILSRHFFQLFHILTGKDSNDSKNEKLLPFIQDSETKPLTLIPMAGGMHLIRLSDDVIARRLAPLLAHKPPGQPALADRLAEPFPYTLPDVFVLIKFHAGALENEGKTFAEDFISATQEGYFPSERFLRVFPLPDPLRQRLQQAMQQPGDWVTRLSGYSQPDIDLRQDMRVHGVMSSASQDLDLAASLLQEVGGANFTLGLLLLLRSMSDKNPVPVQEKALQLAMLTWVSSLTSADTANYVSLLSSLRHQLISLHNISLALFPLRNATIESSLFLDMSRYLVSLGKTSLPSLIEILKTEKERGMRKKLCQLITTVVREDGADILINALPTAEPFLLRNLVMILGDLKVAQAVAALAPLVGHAHNIVRVESVRTLCKIGNEEANRVLSRFVQQSADSELKQAALAHLAKTK